MPTLGQELSDFRERHFVGRQPELTIFDRWLQETTAPPSILNVSGIGGSGKTELLHAFARRLGQLGIPALYLDGRTVRMSQADLATALEPSRHLAPSGNGYPAMVLLIDTYEEIGAHDRWFRESFLSELDSSVRIVLAGRYPVDRLWTAFVGWSQLIRSLPVGPLTEAAGREYLRRRTIVDEVLAGQIWSFTQGHPLALSLATDLVLRLSLREFTARPERYLVLQNLSRRLLAEVEDRQFRELLEAASMVRQFDEAMLAALVGKSDSGDTFEQLSQLSIVRPTTHGLAVHDVVRRALTNELRWRNLDHYAELRSRALAFYSSRFRSASSEDRHWLVADWLSFSTRALIQHLLFEEGEPGEIIVEPAGPGDQDAPRRVRENGSASAMVGADAVAGPDQLTRSAAARLMVARNWDGEVVGYSTVVPVCPDTLPMILGSPRAAAALRASTAWGEITDLPETADTFIVWDLAPGHGAPSVRSALIRDLIGLLARGKRYLVPTAFPEHRAFLSMLGFRPIGGSPADGPTETALLPLELDLREIGAERWVEAVLSGEHLPATPHRVSSASLQPVVQDVLSHWSDDELVSASPLLRLSDGGDGAQPRERAKAIREVICKALGDATDSASDDERDALHALELAYLQRSTSHERLAERLSVSRSTLYRMLNRGCRVLTTHLAEARRDS
ncbi:MAG: hypothetical protein ACRDIY_20100 [Chloroflexota bacterium]